METDVVMDAEPEHLDVEVRFSTHRLLGNTGEPDNYVSNHHGAVVVFSEEGRQRRIGRVVAQVVRIAWADDDRVNLFDVFDAHSAELCSYYGALIDPKAGGLRSDLVEGFDSDLLIVDKIELLPQWRKRGLGPKVLAGTILELGRGCGAAAIHPHPIAYREEDIEGSAWLKRMQARALIGGDRVKAMKKLRQHWGVLGFRRVGRTEFFVLDLSTTALQEGMVKIGWDVR